MKKEFLKPADRVATSLAGVLFTLTSITLLVSQIAMFAGSITDANVEVTRRAVIENALPWLLLSFLFAYLTFWCVRYTYRGAKGYRYVKEESDDQVRRTQPRSRWVKWVRFALFSGGSLLGCYVLLAQSFSTDEAWLNWVILFGVASSTLFAITTLVSILRGWSIEQEDEVGGKLLSGLIGVPILVAVFLVGAALLIWGATSGIGWLASIPTWAAVIIILLILLLLKR